MPNTTPDMSDAEEAAYRRWMFSGDASMPHPNELDWEDDETPALVAWQEHSWLSGYRCALGAETSFRRGFAAGVAAAQRALTGLTDEVSS